MTIDKAIKILEILPGQHSYFLLPDRRDAMKLGIEALKFYRELKRTRGLTIAFRLPGETEEVKVE